MVAPLNRQLWYVKNRRLEFADRFEPRGRKTLVLIVPPGCEPKLFEEFFALEKVTEWKIDGCPRLFILDAASAVPLSR